MKRIAHILILVMLLCGGSWSQSVGAKNKFKVGRSDFQKGNYAKAIPQFEAAIKEDPSFIDAQYLLGLSYMGVENYRKAEETLTYVVGLDPAFLSAHQYLGQVLLVQKKYKEAREHFGRMSKVPGGAASATYCLGVVAYQEKNPQLAEKHWTEAARLDPKDARSRNNLGVLRSLEGKHTEAIIQFQGAARLNPDNPSYVLNEAWEQLELGRVDQARTTAQKARKRSEQRHDIGYLCEAFLAKLDKRWEGMVNYSNSCLEKDKDNTRAWILKAEGLEKQNKPKDALEAYTRALGTDPNQKDVEKAIARLKAAAAPKPPAASPAPAPAEKTEK